MYAHILHAFTHIHTYMHTYMHTHIHMHTHTQTHTHMHTLTQALDRLGGAPPMKTYIDCLSSHRIIRLPGTVVAMVTYAHGVR